MSSHSSSSSSSSADGNHNKYGAYKLYHYDPSEAAAITFAILFGLSTSLHFIQLIWKRSWYFIPFFIGGCFEFVGYIGRTISATQSPNWTLGPYVMQALLILVAPALFAASIYMTLGRIIRLMDAQELSLIRTTWITKIFVTGDVISWLMQSSGGGLLATGGSGRKIGNDLIIGGLSVQVLFFGCFVVTSSIFQYRIARQPTRTAKTLAVPWKRMFAVLYIASALILVRSVFRLIEYIQGFNGYLLQTETYFYVFDASLMIITFVIFNIFHPGEVLLKFSGRPGTEPSSDEGDVEFSHTQVEKS